MEDINYREVEGDLIQLGKDGEFDVIGHGTNCFCTQGAGLAPQMVKAFNTDRYLLEKEDRKGDINKLGTIEYHTNEFYTKPLTVVNAYTQYGFGRNHVGGKAIPLDYEALILCLRKMNRLFKGKHIGLPKIGCGLAGGDWSTVKGIIVKELKDCRVTVVVYNR